MTIEPNSSDSEINPEDELETGGSDHSLPTEGLGRKQIAEQSSLKINIIKGTCFSGREQLQSANRYYPQNFIIHEFGDRHNYH